MSRTLEQRFSGVNQEHGRVKVQVAEDALAHGQGTCADQVDLGCRQIFAYAMRHYPYMPKKPVKRDCVKRAAPTADPAVLRRFADLADQLGFADPLGFEGTGIATLRQYPALRAMNAPRSGPPLLVTSGPGVKKAQRCSIPRSLAYEEDRHALFINSTTRGRSKAKASRLSSSGNTFTSHSLASRRGCLPSGATALVACS